MALVLTTLALILHYTTLGSCTNDDEYSALLQAQIKNHENQPKKFDFDYYYHDNNDPAFQLLQAQIKNHENNSEYVDDYSYNSDTALLQAQIKNHDETEQVDSADCCKCDGCFGPLGRKGYCKPRLGVNAEQMAREERWCDMNKGDWCQGNPCPSTCTCNGCLVGKSCQVKGASEGQCRARRGQWCPFKLEKECPDGYKGVPAQFCNKIVSQIPMRFGKLSGGPPQLCACASKKKVCSNVPVGYFKQFPGVLRVCVKRETDWSKYSSLIEEQQKQGDEESNFEDYEEQ